MGASNSRCFDGLRRFCLGGNNGSTHVPPLRLSLDINETVMIGDSIQGHSMRHSIKKLVTKSGVTGKVREEKIESLLGKLQLPDGSFGTLTPSFLSCIRGLHESGRDFSVVFNTFGQDLPAVGEDWNRFCEGHHPLHPGFQMKSRRLTMERRDCCAYLWRGPQEEIALVVGTVDLAPGTDSAGWGQTTPEEFLAWYETQFSDDITVLRGVNAVRDFYDAAAAESRTLGIRNCYPHWASSGYSARAGKLHFVDDRDVPDFHALFLDDHIKDETQSDGSGIVDNRSYQDPSRRLEPRETIGCNMIRVDPLLSVSDGYYFQDLVAAAGQSFNKVGMKV